MNDLRNSVQLIGDLGKNVDFKQLENGNLHVQNVSILKAFYFVLELPFLDQIYEYFKARTPGIVEH